MACDLTVRNQETKLLGFHWGVDLDLRQWTSWACPKAGSNDKTHPPLVGTVFPNESRTVVMFLSHICKEYSGIL